MAWINKLNPSEIQHGDQPYGAYWIEAPDQPSPFHSALLSEDGSFKEWVADTKALTNSAIDAKIADLEAAQPFSARTHRDIALAMAAIRDIQDKQVNDICLALRALTAGQASFTNTDGATVALKEFDVVRVPDLKKNKRMQDAQALEDTIKPLRSQRVA